jgi:hypothetical protein
MDVISVIAIVVFCAVASAFLYGMWSVENERYEFRKKHGIDPKYHGWKVDTDDEDQGEGKK